MIEAQKVIDALDRYLWNDVPNKKAILKELKLE